MRQSMNALVLATGVALTTSACIVPGYGERTDVSGRSLNLEGDPIADKEITSENCPLITDITYPAAPSSSTESTAPATTTPYDRFYVPVQEAAQLAVDNDLPAATAIYESIQREADPESHYAYTANTFLIDPETGQLGLKAECAAFAGEIATAESMLNRIEDPALRAAYEDNVERWEGRIAEDLADENDVETAYEILKLIDEVGSITQAEERDEVEFWVGSYAEDLARDNPDDIEKALALVDGIDEIGNTVRVDARDEVEFWVESHAERYALDDEVAKASALAQLVDEAGEYTRSSVQTSVDEIILD